MYQITKKLKFSYCHKLLKHPGKCSRYHGHNADVDIVCEASELDERGMVIDFDEISDALDSWIDNVLDHRMILSSLDPIIPFLKKIGEPCVIIQGEPTAEAIAKIIYDEAKSKNLPITKVTLWETPTSSVTYQP